MPDADPASVPVRPAKSADLPRLAELFNEYRAFYGQEGGAERAQPFLQARLGRGDSRLLVATDEGKIVGFAQLYPTWSSISMSPAWVLNDLYVDEEHRNGGVAAALLEAADEVARETGASRIELATARDNRAAQALYEKHGYRRDDVFVHYARGVE